MPAEQSPIAAVEGMRILRRLQAQLGVLNGADELTRMVRRSLTANLQKHRVHKCHNFLTKT